jgi:transposase
VAVLGASNYTYVEATASQRTDDFILGHVHAMEYFGGVPTVCVPDQLRTAIGQPCRYEPTLQRTYAEWARHYGTAVVPARPAKARDKAKVEVGVQVAQRWILARLRHEVFFSLPPLNARIRELLGELNARPMKTYGGQSRRDLFDRFDRPALQPLPPERYVYGEWSQARANVDYHVEVKRHDYSVPHPLIHRLLDVRVSASSVEIFDRGMRVCVHPRHDTPGRHTTIAEHMPKAHRAHLEWSPSRLIQWGATIGAQTAALIEAILADRPHPEQGYRSCLGLLRLGKQYGADRLEAACGRAASGGAKSYRHVQSILKHGLDRQPLLVESVATGAPLMHANVRGPRYYDDPEGEH